MDEHYQSIMLAPIALCPPHLEYVRKAFTIQFPYRRKLLPFTFTTSFNPSPPSEILEKDIEERKKYFIEVNLFDDGFIL